MKYLSLIILLFAINSHAKPYPDPTQVPVDEFSLLRSPDGTPLTNKGALRVYRFQVNWTEGEKYRLGYIADEDSGTEALIRRTKTVDPLGSYRADIIDPDTKELISSASIGTGMEYRLLARAFSFRVPAVRRPFIFRMYAENPMTGVMEVVVERYVVPKTMIKKLPKEKVEARLLRKAKKLPKLMVNIYAEGYLKESKEAFFERAGDVVKALEASKFPGQERFEFRAVFAESKEQIGDATNFGLPIRGKDTSLGLYFPYWDDFGRWYHVLYPTDDKIFRWRMGHMAYDYPIVLVDSIMYWGVGNYNSHTAIPSGKYQFSYLLNHELGHFFGLNEEYEEPAPNRTELTFAPGIYEPWSQNATFLRAPEELKWAHLIDPNTPLPTPRNKWNSQDPVYGAYKGGYSSEPKLNHKPGYSCVMSSGRSFCPICAHAIEAKVHRDLGE